MRFVLAPLAATAVFIGSHGAGAAHVRIAIDLGAQRMHVSSRQGEFDWPVSTGKAGHRTPTGVFRPQRMYAMVHSAKYDNAPMPHAIFFTGGYAIHGSAAVGLLGRPASHGCVRLAPGHAAALFALVKRESATIVISGNTGEGDRLPKREMASLDPAIPFAGVQRSEPETSERVADGQAGDRLAKARETHRAGHRMAAIWRQRYRDEAATRRSLREWADNPLENQ